MPSREFYQDTISSSFSSAFRTVSPLPPERGASSSTDPPHTGEQRSSTGVDHRPVHPEWESQLTNHATSGWDVLKRATSPDFQTVSVFLRDLVATANLAAREGIGDCIFAGWQPHGAGDTGNINRFKSGSHLVMVSKQGFQTLAFAFASDDALKHPGHIDLKLKAFWSKRGGEKACYALPPIGGYTAHTSGCEPTFAEKVRPSIWMENFACPGTRPSHDWQQPPRKKCFCTLTKNGNCNFGPTCNVEVDDDKVKWRTFEETKPEAQAIPGSAGWHASTWQSDQDDGTWELKTKRQRRAGRRDTMQATFREYVFEKEQVGVRTPRRHLSVSYQSHQLNPCKDEPGWSNVSYNKQPEHIGTDFVVKPLESTESKGPVIE